MLMSQPLSAALTVSRLLSEALGADRDRDRDRDEFYHPDGQTHEDLIKYTETHPREL